MAKSTKDYGKLRTQACYKLLRSDSPEVAEYLSRNGCDQMEILDVIRFCSSEPHISNLRSYVTMHDRLRKSSGLHSSGHHSNTLPPGPSFLAIANTPYVEQLEPGNDTLVLYDQREHQDNPDDPSNASVQQEPVIQFTEAQLAAFHESIRANLSSGACFNCGQTGHIKRDCTAPRKYTFVNAKPSPQRSSLAPPNHQYSQRSPPTQI